MSVDKVTQADLLTNKLMAIAVGTLFRALSWVRSTTLWQTENILENGDKFQLPILGATTTNTRAPGAPVVDTTESPSKRDVPIIERYTSWLVDPSWASSEGKVRFEAQRIRSRVNQLAQDVLRDHFSAITQTVGLQRVGTPAVALNKAVYDGARELLTKADIPDEERKGLLSPEMMTDTGNIPEYADFEKLGSPGSGPTGRTGRAGGFFLQETNYIREPNPGEHEGILAWPAGIVSVFPKQETFNDGANMKTEGEIDGMRYYMVQEYVSGYGGARRIGLHMVSGAAVHRDDAVVVLDGK